MNVSGIRWVYPGIIAGMISFIREDNIFVIFLVGVIL